MSELDQIITVNITRNTTFPSQVGFGTPLLFTADPEINAETGTEWGSERVRAYTSLAGVTTDFATTTNTNKMATAIFSQNPSPPLIKVGRRALGSLQAVEFTPTDLIENSTVGFSMDDVVFTVTNGAGATVASIVTALAALTPPTGFTFTDNTTDLQIDGTVAGGVAVFSVPLGGDLEDLTLDPGIATDLAAIAAADDDWYMILLDSTSFAELTAVATYVEANDKTFVGRTFDAEVPDTTDSSDTTSIAATLKASNFDRTALFATYTGDFLGSAWAGRNLPEPPGSITWAYKQLNGVSIDFWNATQSLNLEAKNVNTNTRIAGVNVTRYGTASGGEFLDVIRGSDWLSARIQERVFALLINNAKVAYTDAGIQSIRAEVLAQLQIGVTQGFLAADPEPTCTVPLAINVPPADKSARVLNNVIFRATLAGAIHKVVIEGELNL